VRSWMSLGALRLLDGGTPTFASVRLATDTDSLIWQSHVGNTRLAVQTVVLRHGSLSRIRGSGTILEMSAASRAPAGAKTQNGQTDRTVGAGARVD
jgi:hypothetical protein